MIKLDVIQAYTDYVVAHNQSPYSELADQTFDKLREYLLEDFCEATVSEILDILCSIENEKITMGENLQVLFDNINEIVL